MNLKSVYKYQLSDIMKSVLIFYLVIVCVYIFLFWSRGIDGINSGFGALGPSEMFYNSSFEIATSIFLFVVGLNVFREAFRLSMQNGVSRKNLLGGTVVTFLTIGSGMALIDTVTRLVVVNVTAGHGFESYGLYDSMFFFTDRFDQLNEIQKSLESFLLNFCLYITVLAVGYFITVGYYRMKKMAKIIVSIGVPAFFTVVLPVLFKIIFKQQPAGLFYDVTSFVLKGSNHDNPYFAMGSGILVTSIFLGLTYLMIRRAPIKD